MKNQIAKLVTNKLSKKMNYNQILTIDIVPQSTVKIHYNKSNKKRLIKKYSKVTSKTKIAFFFNLKTM